MAGRLIPKVIGCLAVVTAAAWAQAGEGITAQDRVARDNAWRTDIRKALYVPERLPALESKTWSTFSPMQGVLADRVTYATADGMLVPAVVYRPDPKVRRWKGKLPGIVVVNGHGGDKFSWYAFYSGIMFAQAGAVVVTYDPIGEGERNLDKKSRAGSHDVWPAEPGDLAGKVTEATWRQDWGQRVAGLMQVDLMQGVAYLAHRQEVDPARIGVVGYSMGSLVSGLAGAIGLPGEPAIRALVLSGGGMFDGPGEYYDTNALPCQGPPYRALLPVGDRGAVLYDLNADRGPTYVMNGLADTIMDIPHHGPEWFAALRARAIALHGTDKDMFTTVFYPGVSHRPSWVDRDGVAWLGRELHFAFWGEKQIAAEPVTHVSTWAKENGVDITVNNVREDREGGLDALGTGVPAVERKQLMVLPDQAWEKEKMHLIWEGWVAKEVKAESERMQQ